MDPKMDQKWGPQMGGVHTPKMTHFGTSQIHGFEVSRYQGSGVFMYGYPVGCIKGSNYLPKALIHA